MAQVRDSYHAKQREVARHLGLNPAIIEAIETDNFSQLGPPVFVKGYLSRYARLLNLPEQAVLERYQRQSGGPQEPPPLKVMHPLRRQTRIRDLRGVFYLAIVVAIAWAAIQNLKELDPSRLFGLWSDTTATSTTSTTSTTSPTPPVNPDKTAISQTQYPFQSPAVTAPTPVSPAPSATVPDAAPTTKEVPSLSTTGSTPSITAPAPESMAAPAPVAVATPPPPAETSSPSPVTATTIAAPTPSAAPVPEAGGETVPGEAKLLLEFSNDSWVEVKDAQGNVLVSGLMKADSTRAISGSAPFKITLGNAPATRITLDDRLVNTDFYMPRRGTVSRFTLARDQH